MEFHKNPSSGRRVVPCRQTDRRTGMTKLIVAFRNSANALRKCGLAECPSRGGPSLSTERDVTSCKPELPPGTNTNITMHRAVKHAFWNLRSPVFHIMGYRSCMKLQMGGNTKKADILSLHRASLYNCFTFTNRCTYLMSCQGWHWSTQIPRSVLPLQTPIKLQLYRKIAGITRNT